MADFIKETKDKKKRKLNHVHAVLYSRIFSNKLCGCDFTIISAEGQAFPCHTEILSSSCEVFSNMLRSEWVEALETRLVLQDLTTEGVDAFLRYLYMRDLEQPRKHFSIAVDLLSISHKYMLNDLSSELKKIIVGKQNFNWYSNIDACFELYRLSTIAEEKMITRRILWVFKMLQDKIETRWKIKKKCRDDPELALNLFWDSFLTCTCTSGSQSEIQFESDHSDCESLSESE